MIRSIRWMSAAAVGCLLFTSIGWSQDQLLDELYGRGVHNYFSRNYTAAHQHLTDAINSGSMDPRVYYFRALAYSRLGRPDEARADFTKGSELEVQAGDIYPIGRSLERVQGNDRIALESYRRNAKLLARTNSNKQAAVRMEETRRSDIEVLRNPGAARPAGAPPAAPAAPAPGDPFGAAPADPFGGAGGAAGANPLPEPPPAAAPAVPAPPAEDPFGGAPAPAPAAPAPMPAPPAEDPFGGAPAPAPAAPMPAAPAPMPAPPAEDPFGGAPAPAPAAPMPAAPMPADPFGAAPAVPADPFGAGVAPAAPAPAPAVADSGAPSKSTLGNLFRAFTKALPGETTSTPAGVNPGSAPIVDPAVRPADAQVDPFKDDAPMAPPGPPGPPRPAPMPPPADDPFGATPAAPAPMPAPAPAADDPFGAAPAPAAPMPAPAPAPAVDDPFGAAPAVAPAPAAPPAAPVADPFG